MDLSKVDVTRTWLNLCNSDITDVGLEHLAGFTALEWLDLDGTGITDAGLVHLA